MICQTYVHNLIFITSNLNYLKRKIISILQKMCTVFNSSKKWKAHKNKVKPLCIHTFTSCFFLVVDPIQFHPQSLMDCALQWSVLDWESHKSSLKIHRDIICVGVLVPVGVKFSLFASLCWANVKPEGNWTNFNQLYLESSGSVDRGTNPPLAML